MTLTYSDLKALAGQPVPDDPELPHIGGMTPREEAYIARADEG